MKGAEKVLYFAPRILSILFICFLALFSFDVFQPGLGTGEIAIAFFIHNIPAIILTIILIIAWKKEIVGAIGFGGAGLFYLGFIIFRAMKYQQLTGAFLISSLAAIALPAIVIGILFLINWKRKDRNK
jgi:hypothetical protein